MSGFRSLTLYKHQRRVSQGPLGRTKAFVDAPSTAQASANAGELVDGRPELGVLALQELDHVLLMLGEIASAQVDSESQRLVGGA